MAMLLAEGVSQTAAMLTKTFEGSVVQDLQVAVQPLPRDVNQAI